MSKQIENAIRAGLMTAQPAAHSRRENAIALTAAGTALVRRGDALFENARETVLPRRPGGRPGRHPEDVERVQFCAGEQRTGRHLAESRPG